jgi:hypothetical protein
LFEKHVPKMCQKYSRFLQENGLDDYSILKDKAAAASERFHSLSGQIKELDGKLNTNAALQKHMRVDALKALAAAVGTARSAAGIEAGA